MWNTLPTDSPFLETGDVTIQLSFCVLLCLTAVLWVTALVLILLLCRQEAQRGGAAAKTDRGRSPAASSHDRRTPSQGSSISFAGLRCDRGPVAVRRKIQGRGLASRGSLSGSGPTEIAREILLLPAPFRSGKAWKTFG